MIGICDQSELQRDGNLVSAYAISDIKEEIELLANGQGVPYIGVHGVVVTEKLAGEQGIPKGIYVREVEADSPAMQAGIQNGDVIVKIGEKNILSMKEYENQLEALHQGDTVTVTVQRKSVNEYKELEYQVNVGAR